MWGTMADAFRNEDYYGVKIRQEDDPWFVQLEDTMKYVASSFVPFSIKNMERFLNAGEDPRVAVPMALSGITSAPAYISRSPAQKLAYEMMIGNIPQGSRTREQAEASKARKDLVKKLRSGGNATEQEIQKYSKQQMKLIVKEAGQTPFASVVERLNVDQAMKVWSVAKDNEREQIREILSYRLIRKAASGGTSVNETNEAAKSRTLLGHLGIESHQDAQRLLLQYYRRPGRKDKDEFAGKTRKLQKGYIASGVALAKLYGESSPKEAFWNWYRANRSSVQ
jgi:hypothetical protein